jgi:hypothetical protein
MVSCNSQKEPVHKEQQKKRIEFSKEHENLNVFENYVKKIDGNKSLEKIQSLLYTDLEGNTTEVFAWIDKKMEIVKLQQMFNEVSGRKIERIFYFLNGIKTMSRQIVYYYDKKQPFFTEERSYYSLTNSVITTFSRFAKTENLDRATFKESKKHGIPHETTLSIIKRTGDYETRFQGFEEAFGRKFIVVGTEKQTTTLAFNVLSPILTELIKTEKSSQNKLLEVQFSPMTEPDGFTFQALIDLEYVQNKN